MQNTSADSEQPLRAPPRRPSHNLIDAQVGMLELALRQDIGAAMRAAIHVQIDTLCHRLDAHAVAAMVRSAGRDTATPENVNDALMARCAREWMTGKGQVSPVQMWQSQHGTVREGPTARDLTQWRTLLRLVACCPGNLQTR